MLTEGTTSRRHERGEYNLLFPIAVSTTYSLPPYREKDTDEIGLLGDNSLPPYRERDTNEIG